MTFRYAGSRWLSAALLATVLCCGLATSKALADDAPTNDPAGNTTTGTKADVPGFVVSAPMALSADDAKDPAKVKAYNDAKKAFDDYTASSAKEPLAMKLADAVGHNRISINFVWTLVTGFLVMFMQAGFALVETGLMPGAKTPRTP